MNRRTKFPGWIACATAAAAFFVIGFGGVASAYWGARAPELDPGTGANGLALLAGGLLLALERYRSR